MRIEQTAKYVIPIDKVNIIIQHLENIQAECCMFEKLLSRTLFEIPTTTEKNWIRVRMGDLNEQNEDVCAITYKTMIEHAGITREAVIDLEVEDYDEAVELLDKIGLVRRSKQESKRTKFICNYNAEKYAVSIDEWPWLDDIRLVRVQPLSGAEPGDLIGFIELIGINNSPSYHGGIDQVYIQKLGFSLSDCEDVRFNIPYPTKFP